VCRVVADVKPQLSDGRRRVVDLLKRMAPATPPELARRIGVTEAAVRQHLDGLAEAGLVVGAVRAPAGRGRPAVAWSLTDLATELFPDRHADLTVELLASVRRALGDEGLDKVIEERSRAQLARYQEAVPPSGELRDKVDGLARCRTAEGYLAEVVEGSDGDLFLIEHHCPVCDAATACQGLCRSELQLFRKVLGEGATVERTQHLLSGDQRCAYRIHPIAAAG
jgi:predicted ArsR family transcriptional regulator